MVNNAKVATLKAPCAFGELALMYNAPRAATITASALIAKWILVLKYAVPVLLTLVHPTLIAVCHPRGSVGHAADDLPENSRLAVDAGYFRPRRIFEESVDPEGPRQEPTA